PVAANRHGQHSIWRIASEHGKRVIALDIPFSYPPEVVNGCLVAGYGVPLGEDSVFTYPPGLRAELRSAIGQCEPAVLEELPGVKPELFQAWDEILRNREQMAAYLLERDDWDLFMLVFGVIDNVQHALWNYYDPRMANYYYREAPAYREKLLSYYEKVDGIIGRLLEHADEQTHVVVMSDHGFGSTRPGLFMSSFLAEQGWPRCQAGAIPAGMGRRLMQRALRVYNDSPRLRSSLRNLSGPAVHRVRQVFRSGGLLASLQNIDWQDTRLFRTRCGPHPYIHRADKF